MRLAVRQQGAGPPVALLHGLFGQSRNFGALQGALAARYRVAALDLRNHGDSPHADGMDYPAMAADVGATLAAIGMDRCAVIGHSMGGKVAMRLALDDPPLVARLLVGDIAPVAYEATFAPHAAAMRAIDLAPGLTRRQADAALQHAVAEPGVRQFLLQNLRFGDAPAWRIGLDQIAAGLSDIGGWPATAAQYQGPTLFVGGAGSGYIRAEHHQAIRAWFPAARFATLDNAGHWLHADNPAGFLAVVQAFLGAPDGA